MPTWSSSISDSASSCTCTTKSDSCAALMMPKCKPSRRCVLAASFPACRAFGADAAMRLDLAMALFVGYVNADARACVAGCVPGRPWPKRSAADSWRRPQPRRVASPVRDRNVCYTDTRPYGTEQLSSLALVTNVPSCRLMLLLLLVVLVWVWCVGRCVWCCTIKCRSRCCALGSDAFSTYGV